MDAARLKPGPIKLITSAFGLKAGDEAFADGELCLSSIQLGGVTSLGPDALDLALGDGIDIFDSNFSKVLAFHDRFLLLLWLSALAFS